MTAPVYTERPAGPPGWTVWSRPAPAGPVTHRVLPDGCLDLLWAGPAGRETLIVAGPDTSAWVSATRPGHAYLGVRFAPGLAPGVLGVPADALRDRRVPLADLWPGARVRELEGRLAALPGGPAARAAGMVRLLARAGGPAGARGSGARGSSARGSGAADAPVALPAAVAAHLGRGLSVSATADRAGFSERQLRRRCLAAYGYGPKTLARILRLGRALDLARAGTPYAEVAQVTGYADQAHLAREVRELAGVPLGVLLAESGS